jgi:hypothetical protein
MTTAETARRVFHAYMERAKQRPLTAAEKSQLAKARQILRRARRPATNAARGVPDSFVRFLREQGYIEATFRPDILEQTYVGFRHDRKLWKKYEDWQAGQALFSGAPSQGGLFGNPKHRKFPACIVCGRPTKQIRFGVRLHEKCKAKYRPPAPAATNRRPTLDEATDYRLQQIAEAFESGISKQTGRAVMVESGAGGGGRQVIRRIKGVKSGFPELGILDKDTPAAIAAAIRRGKGKIYERVRWAVAHGFEKTGQFSRSTRPAGRRSVKPHPGRKYCRHCRTAHTKGQHIAHGRGSFHRTHLFSFGAKHNPRERGGLVRMGRLIELRYDRDHGAHPGFYKHVFKSKPTVYYDPQKNVILVKGGR